MTLNTFTLKWLVQSEPVFRTEKMHLFPQKVERSKTIEVKKKATSKERRKKTLFASHRKLMISDRERNWFEKEREKTVIDSSKYFKNTTLFTYLKASKLWRSNT